MILENAMEEIPGQDPGSYNRLFLVRKALEAWMLILKVSRIDKFVSKTRFSMEPSQSVLDSIQKETGWSPLTWRTLTISLFPLSKPSRDFNLSGEVSPRTLLTDQLSWDDDRFQFLLCFSNSKRIDCNLLIIKEFRSCVKQPVRFWLSCLGYISSPGGLLPE